MIAVRPGAPAWPVLELVVDYPGQLSAEVIGQRLWRPRITGTDNYLAARRALVDHGAEWSTRAAALLHRLQQAGMVDRVRPPAMAEAWAEHGLEALELAPPRGARVLAVHGELLRALLARRPASMGDWVGNAPPGRVQRALAELVAWRVVIPPAHRWPTAAGVARVTEVRSTPRVTPDGVYAAPGARS